MGTRLILLVRTQRHKATRWEFWLSLTVVTEKSKATTGNTWRGMEGVGTRFELELELMNCLASPEYLHYLAQSGFLDDPAFLRFLEYLQYFKQPQYSKFITYPQSLAMLDLIINNPPFRKEFALVGFRDFVHQQQFLHWQFGKRTRQETSSEDQQQQQQPSSTSSAAGT